MRFSRRLTPLAHNVCAQMDQAKAEARALGRTVIDLSLGSSDLSAPAHALAAIEQSFRDTTSHGYLLFAATQNFRLAVAQWIEQRFGLQVDPQTEVLPLIGSQEGTAHLPLALMDPGDIALIPNPGYPSHSGGVYLAGGEVYPLPLYPEAGFLPDLTAIPGEVLRRSRFLLLSYPHNPTTATATLSFFEEAVAFCQRHDLVLVHDFPYCDLAFDGYRPPSMLQADPKRRVTIEFFTMSKSYHMGGFRIGFAVGNQEVIRALRQVKAVVDFNQYRGILDGAAAALTGPQDCVQAGVDTFQERRDKMLYYLDNLGWSVPRPEATLYLWAALPTPWREDSIGFCTQLVRETGVALAPGSGFGSLGEGSVRFALVHPPRVLAQAVTHLGEFMRVKV
ncbi:LL-diaminopimelate aminotransferase [Candidatus Cyanaurora vandensis]|uniref:LL-diaminopimelate aminotransferase n=1 Tax=Candidatus Cyanaurora vandensis TaxID=2714958 RepID=UPI00257F1609|nr:LL-diaminopimelate aminotransferase [Candidatus Cyanaurora vandensis]